MGIVGVHDKGDALSNESASHGVDLDLGGIRYLFYTGDNQHENNVPIFILMIAYYERAGQIEKEFGVSLNAMLNYKRKENL
jgi:hypothetical protein